MSHLYLAFLYTHLKASIWSCLHFRTIVLCGTMFLIEVYHLFLYHNRGYAQVLSLSVLSPCPSSWIRTLLHCLILRKSLILGCGEYLHHLYLLAKDSRLYTLLQYLLACCLLILCILLKRMAIFEKVIQIRYQFDL